MLAAGMKQVNSNSNSIRIVGRVLSVASILTGLWATAMSMVLVMKGLFLALFIPPLLVAVVVALLGLAIPGIAGIWGLVLNARDVDVKKAAIIVPLVGLLVGITLGKVAARIDPIHPQARPAPAGCRASTADPSAINTACPSGLPYGQGPCPVGYVCTQSVRHAYEQRSVCEVPCTHDCECMAGAHCANASCQFGSNLP